MSILGWFLFFAFFSGYLILQPLTSQSAQGQVQDLSCPSCVIIPHEEIDIYESLFPLTIRTNSQSYDHNSIIFLYGHLRPENIFNPITITVTNPIGNIVTIEQITPDEKGDFSVNFNTASPLWSQNGNYIIKAQSGDEPRVFKTQVQLVPTDSESFVKCAQNEMIIHADNGVKYCLPYKISGENLELLGTLHIETKTLSIPILTKGLESLELRIPRDLIDSKSSDGFDSEFVVMSDDLVLSYLELESSSDYRFIQILFDSDRLGTIDIIGTSVIPEFGVLAIIIFAISITTVMFIIKKGMFITQKF